MDIRTKVNTLKCVKKLWKTTSGKFYYNTNVDKNTFSSCSSPKLQILKLA